MIWMDELFRKMTELGASDLHLSCNVRPMFRINGSMGPVPGFVEPMTQQKIEVYLKEMTPKNHWTEFEEKKDTDFKYTLEDVGRFRINLFIDNNGFGAVCRLVPDRVPTPEELGIPKLALSLCYLTKGLVIVTGPTGCGKSTTLAALIDQINRNRSDHIITIEDPIEFVHKNIKCLINQREAYEHTNGFKTALRAALREDPDVVLVGEMRDLETVEMALETAETGHLVFTTLHTNTAPSAIDRIIDQFPANRQPQIRTMLAASLKGVIAQTLCKKRNVPGRVAAFEVLFSNFAISAHIREGKTHQIPSTMQIGARQGMRQMNDSLLEHILSQTIDPVEAYMKCVDKQDMLKKFETVGIKFDPELISEAIA